MRASLERTKRLGGGLEIWVLSISVRWYLEEKDDDKSALQAVTTPPTTFEVEPGKAPTTKTLFFTMVNDRLIQFTVFLLRIQCKPRRS